MYRKFLFIALIISVSVSGFAQTTAEKNKALIEQEVSKKHLEFAGTLERELNSTDKVKSKVGFGIANKEEKYRFLFAGDTQELMGKKKPTLKKVYKSLLNEKPKVSTEFSLSQPKISQAPIVKKGVFICNTRSQTTSVVKKNGVNVSEAKYGVTFKWVGKITQDKKSGNYEVKKIKLATVTVEKNFDDERDQLKLEAEKLIAEYYDNLENRNWNAVFEPEVSNADDVRYLLENKSIAVQRDEDGINIASTNLSSLNLIKPKGETFTTSKTDVPNIKINVDPVPFYTEDAFLYPKNAEAYFTYALKFTIAVDENLKGKIAKVDYSKVEFNSPKFDEELAAQLKEKGSKANELATNFKGKITNYVEVPNLKDKEDLTKMFVKNNATVQVSYLVKGEEKINTRSAKAYFANLKGKNIDINFGKRRVENIEMNTVVFPFHQRYTGIKYTDCTDKELYLIYDEKEGKYFVEKITVVKGSTKTCE